MNILINLYSNIIIFWDIYQLTLFGNYCHANAADKKLKLVDIIVEDKSGSE